MNEQAIAGLLVQTTSPDAGIRKNAEKTLVDMEQHGGFTVMLLKILEQSNDKGTQLCAAIYFKNTVRKYWEDGPSAGINDGDRNSIKAHLLTLMCSMSPHVQRQLSEAVRIVGESDFPNQWQSLLPDLTSKLGATHDFDVIIGLLETANTLFKIYRDAEATDELHLKLKYCLEQFQEPLLNLYKQCVMMLDQNSSNPQMLAKVLKVLRLLTRIFYSLNWQTIPEYFEDHIGEWMELFRKLLEYQNPAVVHDDDETAGPIELVQAAIFTNIKLYANKYEDETRQYIRVFAELTWKLLNRTPDTMRYDPLVIIAIKFLTALVMNMRQKVYFENAQAQQEVLQKIVIPNLKMRECDYETFEDNPMEYIRRDIEGSDSDTRRRVACDLVRGLCRHFEDQTTANCEQYLAKLVSEYSANPAGNWHQMDTAITLMIALAVRRYTVVGGVSELNPKVSIDMFFNTYILPVLSSNDVNSQAVVKADAIKFFTTFRNQMPREVVIKVLPSLAALLRAKSFIVHTYAAQAIERVFMIKTPPPNIKYVYGQQDLEPVFEQIMVNLFEILESHENGIENDYVAKAVMRVLTKASPQRIAGITGAILGKLHAVLVRVCASPQNPKFIHYLFESIAALIRSSCKVNPALVEQFEQNLMPSFQEVLQREITELTPYVFQILAQLLELRPGGPSAGYLSLFPPLLRPDVWANRGNIPGLVRLLEAYMRTGAQQTVGSNPQQLEALLGVFQKLLSAKSTANMSVHLLIGIVEFLPPDIYAKYLTTVFQLLLVRVTQLNSKAFAQAVVSFLSVLVGKHGPQPMQKGLEGVGPALYSQIIREVWIPAVSAIKSNTDRKASVIAMTRLLCESPELQTPQNREQCWANLFIACLTILEIPAQAEALETAEEQLAVLAESGYSSSFAKLAYAQNEIRDSFKEIQDPRVFFVQSIRQAQAQQPGVMNDLIKLALRDKPNFAQIYEAYCGQIPR
uniref:Importin N-terminal domain-containing protein n=1 Tax=Mucochytrium quahogii TaxID=96639 RepID=A0A7S2WRA8_9STRA|mmetsp:Transcript_27710/g.44326  ORF Transcript_27710/g.44326 Transcript_27710/m.44326 type:complete len:970 (+) Transcript_27710:206-3115(+)|eukprot:CAMPEP_0203758316 /NCGR_PEP_ID=MMETSP0098-20131031/11087_1 /ASSEMBLY_ACC=CAM_ASM_000208 /TAXON_ID=96639 /ORGANISM=" , Strain NY0313808BC1" /LENGTH=969 /DNA_ID=CAMNT_0050650659 /DNA_START=200 /DNA_END=3106 /DNA_ORIENTATION=-